MSPQKSKNIYFVLYLFFLMVVHSGKSEDLNYRKTEEDSIIRMYGYVYDTISGSPAKIPVKAQLVLESKPYGSEIGIISSNDSSGFYEYYINTNHTYDVEVNAKYHQFHYLELDARKFKYVDEVRVWSRAVSGRELPGRVMLHFSTRWLG